MDRRAALTFLEGALREVYRQVKGSVPYEHYDKSRFDEVTSLDYCVERELIARIQGYDAGARFLSEEYNSGAALERDMWVIDPIDGTCNLTHGIETYGMQCAYCENGAPVLAAVYFPFLGEMFTAVAGEGAWLNGAEIRPVSRPAERSLISFGDFMRDEALYAMERQIMDHVARRVERIRMYGAASIDFCYAACGRLDGSFTFTPNQWDILPGLLICKEAGLAISDAYGKPYRPAQSATVAVFSTGELRDVCTAWWK